MDFFFVPLGKMAFFIAQATTTCMNKTLEVDSEDWTIVKNINKGKSDNFKFPLQCEDHIWKHL